MLHFLFLLIVILEFFLIEWLNRKKLAKWGDNEIIVQVLEKGGWEHTSNYKFSQSVAEAQGAEPLAPTADIEDSSRLDNSERSN